MPTRQQQASEALKAVLAEAQKKAPPAKPAEYSWAVIGENVGDALKLVRKNDRERAVRSMAVAYNTYPARVLKSVNAYDFVMRVDSEELRVALLKCPLALVDILTLWSSHDEKAAFAKARDVVEGRYSQRSLMEAEKAARPQSKTTGLTRIARWRDLGTKALLAGPAEGFRVVAPPDGLDAGPIDIWLQKGKGKKVGVLLIGPYAEARDYRRNIPGNLLVCLGLDRLGYRSWIALPIETTASTYREHCDRLAPGVIKVVELALPAKD